MKNKKARTKTLSFTLWLNFVALSVIIFVILWLMQVVFLQNYYSSMKKKETIQIGSEIEDLFKNALDYKDQIDNTAYRNSASIYILTKDGDVFYTSASSTGLYAPNNGEDLENRDSNFLAQMPGRNISIDLSDVATKIENSSNKRVSYTLSMDRFKSQIFVYGKVIPDTDYCYVIIMSIDPIDATSTVIRNQLVYITIISLLFSTVISLFMSKRISKPIKEMNESAKKLENGDYDVVFKKCGYEELDELADTLNSATNSLKRTDEIKREIIANVSHDLKTPLTMIKAYSEMIRDLSGDNKQKREEHLKVIIDETDRLTRLVNDMMDLSKIESGMIVIQKEKFNFSEVASSLVNRIKIANEDENHKIEASIPNEIYVNADRTKIEQVLYNLIINAIKHGGKDKVTINVKVRTTQKRVKVEVIDNGVGISSENLKHIWDRYYRASESFTRNVEGSGLGLSIVKNILIKHGSDYGVESEVGKGSDFWFDLEKVSKKEVIQENEQKEK